MIRVTHTLDDLESDFRIIARRAPGDMRQTVLDGIRAGNEVAKDFARASNDGKSASRKYPGTFRPEMGAGFRGAEVSVYSGEYGPIARGQGQLAHILENGEGPNAPQNNLARSADIIGPAFGRSVQDMLGDWFWPST